MKKSEGGVLFGWALLTLLVAQPALPGTPSYIERSLTLALPTSILRTVDRVQIALSPGSEITVEGTDAATEGSFSLPLRVQKENHEALITEWSQRLLAQQTLKDRALTFLFPDTRCVVVKKKLEGICLGKTILRLPKKTLIDLSVNGWTRARFRNVRARTLELTAPSTGFLRMNGTLANILLSGGGAEFDSVISGVLAADPNNPHAGDLTAHLSGFRTLLLARIQGQVQIAAETPSKDAYLRVDEQVVTRLPYERP